MKKGRSRGRSKEPSAACWRDRPGARQKEADSPPPGLGGLLGAGGASLPPSLPVTMNSWVAPERESKRDRSSGVRSMYQCTLLFLHPRTGQQHPLSPLSVVSSMTLARRASTSNGRPPSATGALHRHTRSLFPPCASGPAVEFSRVSVCNLNKTPGNTMTDDRC